MSRFFIVFVGFFILLVLLRLALFYLFPLPTADGRNVHFTTTILDDPKILGNKQQVTVRAGNFWQSTPIIISTSTSTQLAYGDTAEIAGTIKYVLLKNKNNAVTIYSPQIAVKKTGFLPIFGRIRQEIEGFCEKTFSQPYSALLAGMLLGVKSSLPQSLTASFRITGVSHVVAASGMNVTLVAGFLMSFLGSFLKRQHALFFSMAGIVGYMILSGLDPSILRAGIMGILVFGSQLFGKQYTVLYSLFLTTGLLIFWDPLLLLDVGFQLSVLATIGIVFLKPLIPLKGFLLDDVGTTLAAQVATVPVLLGTFGSYGVLSLLVNALVLWTVPIVTILGGIGITLGFIFQPIGQLFLWILYPLLWYFVTVVEYFSHFNAVWQIPNWPIFLTLGYYLIVGGGVMLIKKSRQD